MKTTTNVLLSEKFSNEYVFPSIPLRLNCGAGWPVLRVFEDSVLTILGNIAARHYKMFFLNFGSSVYPKYLMIYKVSTESRITNEKKTEFPHYILIRLLEIRFGVVEVGYILN